MHINKDISYATHIRALMNTHTHWCQLVCKCGIIGIVFVILAFCLSIRTPFFIDEVLKLSSLLLQCWIFWNVLAYFTLCHWRRERVLPEVCPEIVSYHVIGTRRLWKCVHSRKLCRGGVGPLMLSIIIPIYLDYNEVLNDISPNDY